MSSSNAIDLCEAGYISWRPQGPLWHVRRASMAPVPLFEIEVPFPVGPLRKEAGAALRGL